MNNSNEMFKQALSVGVRAALVWIMGVTAAHYPGVYKIISGWVSSEGGVTVLAVSIAGTLLVALQAFYTRMRSRLYAKVALQSPPRTPPEVVDGLVKSASVATILTADSTKV